MENELLLLDDQDSTAPDAVVPAPVISRTRALSEEAGYLRNQTRILNQEVSALHEKATRADWEAVTQERAKESHLELLHQLSSWGFSWRDIARMVGVSVPALRKWRMGDSPSGTNRRKIAALVALGDILKGQHLIVDYASWMEMPITPTSLTLIDLYAEGLGDAIIEYAGNHITSEQLLDRYAEDWRTRYRSDYQAFEAADGNMSLRPRGDSIA